MAPDAPTPDPSPHSRACGWRAHPHGPECSTNCPTCHGGPMPDPSPDTPDTPNVCPTCGSDEPSDCAGCEMFPGMEHGWQPGACPDGWHDSPNVCPRCLDTGWVANVPDAIPCDCVTALVERLRDDALRARHHDEVLTADDACRWGGVGALLWAEDMVETADALEAQAARITELEAAIRKHRDEIARRSSPDIDPYPTDARLWALLETPTTSEQESL